MASTPPRATTVLVDLRCSVAVIKDDQVLLLHRSAWRLRDHDDWVLPGGHPVAGESMHACAARETKEETGYVVDVGRCLFVYEVVGPEDVARRVELVFSATARGQQPQGQPDRGHRPRWVPLSELRTVNLRPPLAGHLRGLRQLESAGAAYLGNLWRPTRTT